MNDILGEEESTCDVGASWGDSDSDFLSASGSGSIDSQAGRTNQGLSILIDDMFIYTVI